MCSLHEGSPGRHRANLKQQASGNPTDEQDFDRCAGPLCPVQVAPWKRIVLTRGVALAPTLLVALLARSPNKLDVLNQWLNVLQSIQLPFAIVPVRVARACAEPSLCADISACCRVGTQRLLSFVAQQQCWVWWMLT